MTPDKCVRPFIPLGSYTAPILGWRVIPSADAKHRSSAATLLLLLGLAPRAASGATAPLRSPDDAASSASEPDFALLAATFTYAHLDRALNSHARQLW